MHYFGLFLTEILKPRVKLSRVWTKKQIVGNFEKIFIKFLKKIAKNQLFWHVSLESLTNNVLPFRAFGRNT